MSEAWIRFPALRLSCETLGTSPPFSELVRLENNGGSEVSHVCKSHHQVNADGRLLRGEPGCTLPPQSSVSLHGTQLGGSPALLLTPHPRTSLPCSPARRHPLGPSNLPHRLLLGALPLTVSRGSPGAGEGGVTVSEEVAPSHKPSPLRRPGQLNVIPQRPTPCPGRARFHKVACEVIQGTKVKR